MRLEDAGPRTWLLAAVAGWALLAWLLALAGMGGRLQPLPADPELLQALPPLRPAPPLRLQAIGEYRQISERPLFAEDRRPHPFFLQGEGQVAEDDAFDYVLTSVLITPELKLAILQPADGGRSVRVRLDEAPEPHPAWRLVGLSERSAVFAGPEGERTLELRVFDGVGGAPPTAVSSPGDGAASDPRIPIEPPRESGREPRRESPNQPPPAPSPAGDAKAPAPAAEDAKPSPPMTEQAQMQAIRERIQARREQLRRQSDQQPPDESR